MPTHRVILAAPDLPRADGQPQQPRRILIPGVDQVTHDPTHRHYHTATGTPIATVPEDQILTSEILNPTP